MNNWKKDYQQYKLMEQEAYDSLIADEAFIQSLESMLPHIDIHRTLEKAHREYWSQELLGWELKKKKRSKTINWKLTYTNACKMGFNQIKKNHPKRFTPSQAYDQMTQMHNDLESIFNG